MNVGIGEEEYVGIGEEVGKSSVGREAPEVRLVVLRASFQTSLTGMSYLKVVCFLVAQEGGWRRSS